MSSARIDDWAADQYEPQTVLDLHGAALEFVSAPTGDTRPAPYYAELVKHEGGERRVFRTFFHSVEQLGLHPRSSNRLDGLFKGKINLFIDPECPQPRCSELRAMVTEYPANGETHHCLVLEPDFRAVPLEQIDQFAKHRKIRSFAS